MRKSILKMFVFALTFVLALIIAGKIMNKGHDNLTVEMASASLPLVTLEYEGIAYNQMHGYVQEMNVSLLRDCVTVLDENRSVTARIDTFGETVSEIAYELRSIDGERLIENSVLEEVQRSGNTITCHIALKDLIELDTEYSLAMILTLEDGRRINYYTAVIRSDDVYAAEKFAFVLDFHDRTFDKEKAKEITRYLETNSRLEDNSSFHKVNIHSSLKQITWGDLKITKVSQPLIQLTNIDKGNASFLLQYRVAEQDNENSTEYEVEEYYRIRYTTDRIYLLSFERTMTQIAVTDKLYANDKFLLGIVDPDVPMMESSDGNIVAFVTSERLYGYDSNADKLIQLFDFCDEQNDDMRTRYRNHAIKILDIDEGGNICFAVYGYMNRGRHEGEVGIQIINYSSRLNTTEELVYIPSDKPFSAVAAEVENLLYTNRDNMLFLQFDQTVYRVDLVNRTYTTLLNMNRDDMLKISQKHGLLVWTEGDDFYHSRELHIYDMARNEAKSVYAGTDEVIMPLGFMNEDAIYGVAKAADVTKESTGNIFFPMYKIGICNAQGELLKEYQQPGVYITGCTIETNQITLECIEMLENGSYRSIAEDHITNNTEPEVGKNVIVAADIDVYERYVQIKVRNTIDSKNLKVLNPKEVVYEGGRTLTMPEYAGDMLYYAYGPYGVEGIFTSAAKAVQLGTEVSGKVLDQTGRLIWKKENRATRNQIMAFKEASVTEEKSSTAVCLDSMFSFCGLMYNTQDLLDSGKTAYEILCEGMEKEQILNLSGCPLNSVLYYVDHEVPILVLLQNKEAVLVTGFNEQNVVVMNPVTGTLAKKGMNDSKDWFEQNGNCFITYVPK